MKTEEHSYDAEVPGEAGSDREWRVAAAMFTPRRQAHSLLSPSLSLLGTDYSFSIRQLVIPAARDILPA